MRRLFLVLLVLFLLPALGLAGTARHPVKKSTTKSVVKSAKKPGKKSGTRAPKAAAKPLASPGFVLECPKAANLGEAFVVRLRAAKAPASVRLTWLGRQANITGRDTPDGWEALVLLGSDVGSTSVGRHSLVVRLGGKGARSLRKVVRVRPVERLNLDEAMARPPAEVYPRILAEHRLIQRELLGTLSRVVPPGTDARRWSLPLARPVPGEATSGYGLRRILNGQPHAPHRGLDMEAETGQPVLAAAEGRVLFSGELYYAGDAVYVDHGQGLVSAYFHLSERRVQAGDEVARGVVLGLAGATGRSTGPHLHFGLWAWGRYVDPEPLFLYDAMP
ncbi:MAG: M23 family metallopeptidase [Proteobacteria bacterium]|nr:M23 family metallopeptidase [Pseudomonadota bacterium]